MSFMNGPIVLLTLCLNCSIWNSWWQKTAKFSALKAKVLNSVQKSALKYEFVFDTPSSFVIIIISIQQSLEQVLTGLVIFAGVYQQRHPTPHSVSHWGHQCWSLCLSPLHHPAGSWTGMRTPGHVQTINGQLYLWMSTRQDWEQVWNEPGSGFQRYSGTNSITWRNCGACTHTLL